MLTGIIVLIQGIIHTNMKIVAPFLIIALTALQSCTKDGFVRDYSVPDQVVTKVALSEEQEGYMKAGNQFSLNLLEKAFEGKDLILSPLSLQMALAMSLNGAEGETAQEIQNALGYKAHTENDINEYCKLLMEQLPNVDKSVTLKILNGIITDDDFTLRKGFTNTLRTYYYAPAEASPFESAQTLDRINDWAGRNTEWQVYPLLDNLPAQAVAVILDAIYFKAKWRGSFFESAETESRDFTDENGESTRRDFMCTKIEIPYYSTKDFQLVDFPYANDKLAMYVVLPRAKGPGSCKDLITSLQEDKLSAAFHSTEHKFVSVIFPKYEIKSSLKLKNQLQKVGIIKAFDEADADFTRMYEKDRTSGNVWIDDIHQKTVFKVTQWGTEATSATAVVYQAPVDDAPEDYDNGAIIFNANHPFLFFVVERGSGAILFEGVFTGGNGND